jgi:hypothetical protein
MVLGLGGAAVQATSVRRTGGLQDKIGVGASQGFRRGEREASDLRDYASTSVRAYPSCCAIVCSSSSEGLSFLAKLSSNVP